MEKENIGIPLLGDKFPSMVVKTTHGNLNLPHDYKGKWFVLFSHPGDFTPVCTTEFIEFAKRSRDFKKLNCELIGLSVDQVFSHLKWVEWINDNMDVEIPFPVIADELGNVSKELGMIHSSKGTNTVRAVFIVDDKGIVRLIMYYPQEVGRNVSEILRSVNALIVSDSNNVATPENYPNNSFLKDKVIIPPASSEDMIKQRKESSLKGDISCKDWWFCYKDLN